MGGEDKDVHKLINYHLSKKKSIDKINKKLEIWR